MNDLITWAGARLKEKSTWTGIIGFASTSLGLTFAPEQAEAIAVAGMAVTSLVLVFVKTKA